MNMRSHNNDTDVEEYDFINGNHLILRYDPLKTFSEYSHAQISAKLHNPPVWAIQSLMSGQGFEKGIRVRYDAKMPNMDGLIGFVDEDGILEYTAHEYKTELMPMLKMCTQAEEVYFYSDTLFCIRQHGEGSDFIGELS